MMRPEKNRKLALLCACIALVLSACGGAQARKAKHLEKGRVYLTAGNFEKARVEFQNALQITPTDPEARFENGVVDEKLGKAREAAQYYQSAIDVRPDHLGARTNLARLYIFSALPDRAMELIEPALIQHPDDSELLTLRAAVHVQRKDLSAGRADAERAVQLDPTNADAVSALAGIYVSLGERDEARSLLEQAIRKIPATVDLRLALAQLYAQSNRPSDAEAVLIDIVRLRPTEDAQRIRLAQFYARQKRPDDAERVLREGVRARPEDRDLKLSLIDFLSSNRGVDVARKELEGMVAAEPKSAEMKFALAKFYEGNHQAERAEKIYRTVIDAERLDAAGLAAHDRLAMLLAERNDLPGAEKLLADVLAKSPRDTDALILRGNLALAQQDPKSAIADLRAVLRDQPNSAGLLRTLSRAHLANGEPAIAEETLRRAVEVNPKDASLRLDLARLLAQLGKPDQAKPMLVELVKEYPNNIAALDTLFRVAATGKDYETARSAAEAMVATQPKGADGYVYEGILAEESKHNDEALRLYGQAADLQPAALQPLESQVRLLVQEKRVPEALKRLDDAIARAPAAAFASNLKGDVLMSQNRPIDAQAAYREAVGRAAGWWAPYRGLAMAQFAATDPEGALATLRGGALKVDRPDLLEMELATYYERTGKSADAIRQYESIVGKNPQSELAVNNLAMLLVTYGSGRDSVDRAKSLTARFANSSNPSFLDTYGWVLFKHGEAAASVPVLERVVAEEPDAPVMLYHLGMAQSQAGNTSQARGNLARAVKSGAKFSGLDEAKATLERLAQIPGDGTPKT